MSTPYHLEYTVSHKLQLPTVNRFLTEKGLEHDSEVVSCLKMNTSENFHSFFFKNSLPNELKSNTFSVTWIKFKDIVINLECY